MLQIRSFDEAGKHGAFAIGKSLSNVTWSADEIRNLIGQCALWLKETEAGNLWVTRSGSRNQLFYQLDPVLIDTLQPGLLPSGSYVAEVVFTEARSRQKDTERKALENLGFMLKHHAVLMSCPGSKTPTSSETLLLLRNAGQEDLSFIETLFASCFDCLTDAIPDRVQLAEEIRLGNVLIAYLSENKDQPVGGLMMLRSKRRLMLRHIAILPSWRKQGIGTELMNGILRNLSPGEQCILWVKADNIPALRLYGHVGFKTLDRRMDPDLAAVLPFCPNNRYTPLL